MILLTSFSLFLILLVSYVYSANILLVTTIASISHQIVFQPIWKELSLRGHKVTVLTPNPLNDSSLVNLTEIDVSFMYKTMDNFGVILAQGLDHWTIMHNLGKFAELSALILSDRKVQNFINDNNKSYDVIIAEIMDPAAFAIAAKFKCPIIGISSFTVPNFIHEAIGTPIHPVLHPDYNLPYYRNDLSFYEKLDAVLFDWYEWYNYKYVYYPTVTTIARQFFKETIPDLNDIIRNISLLFLNTNPILHGVRPYGPNVIEFGGGNHLKPPQPLPLELKLFLDNATEGVIYFSLGSNVKSKFLAKDKRNILIQTFARLPYKVLWKFEDDQLEGKPENVKIYKWLPQQDVLRHPNIKLFITQAGLQSTEEALLSGVPILAIPFMADQYSNAKCIKKLEFGLHLNFQTLTEEEFHTSIMEIIKTPKYKRRAEDIGNLLRDQPMTGLEKVIWWTEYVIRNKGALHLRNPRVDIPWTEFLILDVGAFLIGISFLVLLALYKINQYVFYLLFQRKQLKEKSI